MDFFANEQFCGKSNLIWSLKITNKHLNYKSTYFNEIKEKAEKKNKLKLKFDSRKPMLAKKFTTCAMHVYL